MSEIKENQSMESTPEATETRRVEPREPTSLETYELEYSHNSSTPLTAIDVI